MALSPEEAAQRAVERFEGIVRYRNYQIKVFDGRRLWVHIRRVGQTLWSEVPGTFRGETQDQMLASAKMHINQIRQTAKEVVEGRMKKKARKRVRV